MAARSRKAISAARTPTDGLAAIGRAIGVSRVARWTGFDRTGVEVACAIRPEGHVSQRATGRGETFEAAKRAAVLQAAELWATERVDPALLTVASRRELARRFGTRSALDPGALGSGGTLVAPELWSDELRIAWRQAEDLDSGSRFFVPAQAVHRAPLEAPALGPAVFGWVRNGSAAHPTREGALLNGLLETVERDALARALPKGWTAHELRRRMLSADSIAQEAPRAWARVEALSAGGFQVHLFDLAPLRGGVRMPVVGALLFEPGVSPVPMSAGYACRLDPEEALLQAVLETAQARLPFIHGDPEDLAAEARAAAERFAQICARVRASRTFDELPKATARNPHEALQVALDRVHAAGFHQVLSVSLAGEGDPVHVERVLVPGFRVPELPAPELP